MRKYKKFTVGNGNIRRAVVTDYILASIVDHRYFTVSAYNNYPSEA